MNAPRVAHIAVALLAVAGIALHFATLDYPGEEVGWRAIRLLSYFTILANGLVAVAATGFALPSGRWHDRAVRPGLRTAVTLYILVTALVFHLLLRNTEHPGPIGWWGNMLQHQAVPAAWTACWLAFAPHGGIDRRAPWRWLLFPLAFAGWTLVHGAASGWYPYPFMNVATRGYSVVLRNITLIGLVFLALGYALRWGDAWLAAKGDTGERER